MTLDPREHESFEVDGICQLVGQFYPEDFSDQEKTQLKMQLSLHKHSVIIGTPEFKTLHSMPDLCQWMVKTRRSTTYDLRIWVSPPTTIPGSATAQILEDEYGGWLSGQIVYDSQEKHHLSDARSKGDTSIESYATGHHILLAHASAAKLYRKRTRYQIWFFSKDY
ncbi:hypothetical protein RHMOL_Rhmol13G0014500 [Rhododendron molle]|uniref:Uncharacterized protein n=1 Tax=Rhododendron molle TaxID=49168 RepID=A0ACC0L2R9_RHOML|nr:hypothetical protein RHMOL_Rhmol13G0014500 [Rhododendron molle]